MHTTRYGWENSWKIESDDGTEYCRSESLSYNEADPANNKTFTEICNWCDTSLQCRTYKVICSDTYGDGWERYGYHDGAYVQINGRKYCEDFHTGYSTEDHFQLGEYF